MVMGILEEIAGMILHDSLFDSALAEWVKENDVDEGNGLYMLLRYDESTRAEIAKETVEYCGKYVADKRYWKTHIARDTILGNQLKMMFGGLKILCEVSMDSGPLTSPAVACHQWKLHSTGTGSKVGTVGRLLAELASIV
jgi:hypothetical protein